MATNVTVTVYLGTNSDLLDKIQKLADKAGVTRNEWIKQVIEEAVKKS